MSEELEKTEIYWLSKIFSLLDRVNQPPDDRIHALSSYVPYVVDYHERDFIYLFSATSFTLTIEDLGTLPIVAGQLIALSLPVGTRCFAQGVAASSPVYVSIRCTNKSPGVIPV